jgi:hypothetical protein
MAQPRGTCPCARGSAQVRRERPDPRLEVGRVAAAVAAQGDLRAELLELAAHDRDDVRVVEDPDRSRPENYGDGVAVRVAFWDPG